jgi:transposase
MSADYSKGIIKQIEELTVQNERLITENAVLRTENRILRARLTGIEATMEARIAAAVETAVKKATAPLMEELAIKSAALTKAEAEIDRLKAQIGKNSGNSSKPPSQDGLKRIANSREKSDRKSGGQVGHPGKRLELPKDLDELVERGFARRETVDHTNGAEAFIKRFSLDVDVTVVVTEHRYPIGGIPCKHWTEVIYGDNIKAFVAILSAEGIVAEERLSDLFSGITHGAINLSDATIESFLSEFAEKIGPELEVIKTDLLNGTVMHVDETPMRCAQKPDYSDGEPIMRKSEKGSFNAYIRTHSNETATLYTVNPQKDAMGCERDGILPQYIGIISQDHESKFYNYGKAHATCGAHLLRELKGLFELQKVPWADEMRQFIAGINAHKNAELAADETECDADMLSGFETRYDNLLETGKLALETLKEKELGHVELRRMLTRLTDYKACYLLFIRDYRAPFTNNQAERDLRPCKTKQKVSGCFRSWTGIQKFAKIRSFFSTAKKRSMNLFESISLVLKSSPVFSGE